MSGIDLALMVLGAGIIALFLASLSREIPPPDAPEVPDRVLTLCAQLTGDPLHDQAVMNQLLALGSGALAPLLEALTATLRETDEQTPRRLARIEGLIADFGLMAIDPIAARLQRLQPTSPLANSLVRVLYRLGQPGAQKWVRGVLENPALMGFLPRFRRARGHYRDPPAAASGALIPRLANLSIDDLTVIAALIVEHPAIIDDLWAATTASGRIAILAWLRDWLPVANGAHVVAGLMDRSPQVRAAAADLARLMTEPALVPALIELAGDAHAPCRVAALRALANQPSGAARAAISAAAGDADRRVCLTALELLAFDAAPVLRDAVGRAALGVLQPDPLLGVLHALSPFDQHDARALMPIADASAADQRVLVAMLGRQARQNPRARERLIRVIATAKPIVQAWAIHALVRAGEPSTPDLLAKATSTTTLEARLVLQEAAQCLGAAAVMPLARQIDANDSTGDFLLPILRALDYSDAVPALLHALDDVRHALATTIACGGSQARQMVDEGLQLPSLGLLAPALRYLASWATADDVPALIALYDAHPPLRGVILNLIEMQVGDATGPLAARIEAGGGDDQLHGLEARHAILAALDDAPWTRQMAA